jgi:hypothetical protein
MDINSGACAGEDDNYPLTRAEIKDTLQASSDMHCMMASHGDVSGSRTTRVCGGRTASFQIITQAQICQARSIYTGEEPLSLNPIEEELAALRFIVNKQKA